MRGGEDDLQSPRRRQGVRDTRRPMSDPHAQFAKRNCPTGSDNRAAGGPAMRELSLSYKDGMNWIVRVPVALFLFFTSILLILWAVGALSNSTSWNNIPRW